MKKEIKFELEEADIRQREKAARRDKMKKKGLFDGRGIEKVFKPKKRYNRKEKHKPIY